MPYTAPLQVSPSASKSASPPSPGLTRSNSSPNAATSPPRPPLPHSHSSTSYLKRHRRSSSVGKITSSGNAEFSIPGPSHASQSFDPHASLRQSPPPVSNGIIPNGAIISPPESSHNSSDDESPGGRQRGQMTFAELDAAIRNLQLERGSSSTSDHQIDPREPRGNNGAPPRLSKGHPALSAEARKISHSRSSTEPSIQSVTDSPASSSSNSDGEMDERRLLRQSQMVRKKSGELVRPALRPASRKRRPSSMPGTPTYAKNVHFDTQLEHIRHFLQLDKPLAVSANTSPVETYTGEEEYPFYHNHGSKEVEYEWEIRLANFPRDSVYREKLPVRLERMFLSSDNKNLVGVVAVANLAFHKQVVARFTFDYWKTVSEVGGEYNHDIRRKQAHDGYDRFNFAIKLADQANLENKTMFVCIRYTVGSKEFWDNNRSMNYQVDFMRKEKGGPGKSTCPSAVPRRNGLALPRHHTLPTSKSSRPRSMPASFDDFSSGLDTFDSGFFDRDSLNTQSPLSLNGEDEQELVPDTPRPREKPAPQAFGHRYNFGLSLSATMQSPTLNQDRTLLSAKAKAKSESLLPSTARVAPSFLDRQVAGSSLRGAPSRATTVPKDHIHPETLKPASIISSKPHPDSSVYKELVDKYCFVGPLYTF